MTNTIPPTPLLSLDLDAPEVRELVTFERECAVQCVAMSGEPFVEAGRVTVRLAGSVGYYCIEDGKPNECGIKGFDESFDPSQESECKWIIGIIKERHIAGTLPRELCAGNEPGDWRLKEVTI